MKRGVAVILVLISSLSYGYTIDFDQDLKKNPFKLNRRAKHPAGFNIYFAGPVGLAGASFDYFIVPKFSVEIGAGIRDFDANVGYFGGGRFHFFGNSFLNTTPYLGLFSGFEFKNGDIRNYNLYIPFGIQRIKKNKTTWSIEVAYQRNTYSPGNRIYGGGKLGFRF